jgi:hypothetical protein
MNVGQQTIEWLYSEQLKIDAEWSIRTAKGFTWWGQCNAQTIEVVGEEKGPDGNTGYLISVRTDLLKSLELTNKNLDFINLMLMSMASMSGPVYDAKQRTLSLHALVRVHAGIAEWMRPLISLAATLQVSEAMAAGHTLEDLMFAEENTSFHPQNGYRDIPDEMTEIVSSVVQPLGMQPCKWHPQEFKDAVDGHMQGPPSLMANAGGAGFTVEFPYDGISSLCQVMGGQPHPKYGNGLFLIQTFPVRGFSDVDGIKLALSLNAEELTQKPTGYGFGSYAFRDGSIHFTSFFPNAMYRPGLLPNIYFTCAARAQAMAWRLAKKEWTADSFKPQHSAMGRFLGRFAGK